MRTATQLTRSTFTSLSLRHKLAMCGSRTTEGYWHFCRSPACDRCRRHRARITAESISDWSIKNESHRLQKLRIITPSYRNPLELLEGIRDHRNRLRSAFDRNQRQNVRWASVKCFGFFSPAYKDGLWSAEFIGIVHLGRLHEITFLDALEKLVSIRLQPFPKAVLKNDVHSHIHYAVENTRGLRDCSQDELSGFFNALDDASGFKALIFRRGFQS
jgi:hypothetical protein